VDDVELAGAQARRELFPDEALEVRVGDRLQRGGGRPAHARLAAEQAAELVGAAGDFFGIDRGEIFTFDQPGAEDRVAVADLRDEMRVADVH
jgi:hypothetical protein